MRIVGGKYKGRIFKPNKHFNARPTTDLAKEGLFNILENRYDFSTKNVLDLFSGTGSIGYEFVSRGCKNVSLVENNYHHFVFIREIIATLGITNAEVYKADTFKFIKKCGQKFDIIFADPPYNLTRLNEIPDAVLNAQLLNDGGVFILEHPKEYSFTEHQSFKEIRNYGKVNFSFFE